MSPDLAGDESVATRDSDGEQIGKQQIVSLTFSGFMTCSDTDDGTTDRNSAIMFFVNAQSLCPRVPNRIRRTRAKCWRASATLYRARGKYAEEQALAGTTPRGGREPRLHIALQPLRALPIGGATTGSRCRYSSRQITQPVNAEIGGGIAAIVVVEIAAMGICVAQADTKPQLHHRQVAVQACNHRRAGIG
jgi:hypothetical protein